MHVHTANSHPWFRKDLNAPKTRALHSSLWDDDYFWESVRFVNDLDVEIQHRPEIDKLNNKNNYQGQEDLFHMLSANLETLLILHGVLGMRFGPQFDLTFGSVLKETRDFHDENRLWRLFRPTLRIPSDG